jgi:putative transcriptional regulator
VSALLEEKERVAMEFFIACAPEDHPIIPGTGGFRKARWAGSGGGKYREASHVKGERKLPTRRILLLDQVDVKRIRNQARMSQAEFARAFCINPTTLKEWEQGSRKPDVTTRACLSIPGNDRKAINAVAGNRRYRRVTDSSEPFTREMYRHAMPRCFS